MDITKEDAEILVYALRLVKKQKEEYLRRNQIAIDTCNENPTERTNSKRRLEERRKYVNDLINKMDVLRGRLISECKAKDVKFL